MASGEWDEYSPLSLKKAESDFRTAVSEELGKLIEQGKKQDLSVLLLLRRVANKFELPTSAEIKDAEKCFRFLSKEQVVRALVIQGEIRRLKSEGFNNLKAIEEMRKKVKIDSVEYVESELQSMWDSINSVDVKDKEDEENEQYVSDKLKNFGFGDSLENENEIDNTVNKKRKGRKKGKLKMKKGRAAKLKGDEPVQFEEIFNRKQMLNDENRPFKVIKKRLPKGNKQNSLDDELNNVPVDVSEGALHDEANLDLSTLSPLNGDIDGGVHDDHSDSKSSHVTKKRSNSSSPNGNGQQTKRRKKKH